MDALRVWADQKNVSMAELVRQGVDQLLADLPLEEDPLWNIVGLGSSEDGDLALNHDEHLANLERTGNGG
jgi:hypothetical protein